MRVYWTHTAIAHLLAISEQSAMFPQSGREVPEYGAPDFREVIERPYRIISRIREDHTDVLAVVHRAQVLPRSLKRREATEAGAAADTAHSRRAAELSRAVTIAHAHSKERVTRGGIDHD